MVPSPGRRLGSDLREAGAFSGHGGWAVGGVPSGVPRGRHGAGSPSLGKPLMYVNARLGSAVISSTVVLGSQEISTSVQYDLWHNTSEKLQQRSLCAFWNFSISPETGGGWSTAGCSMRNTRHESSVCFCNHTTNFAILLQVYEVQRSSEEESTLKTLTFIGCGVSLCALLVTFILFLAVG
ncbi:hypothetical protein FKM82_019559 [Ascaphus truei]